MINVSNCTLTTIVYHLWSMDSKSTKPKCLIGQNQGWRLISYQSVPQRTVEATKVRSMCFGNVDVSAHFWDSFPYSKQSFHRGFELLNGVREGDIVERLILIVLVLCFSTWRRYVWKCIFQLCLTCQSLISSYESQCGQLCRLSSPLPYHLSLLTVILCPGL
jgi:hypothetical protein